MDANEEIKRLNAEVKSLKKELSFLKLATKPRGKNLKTVIVPPELEMIFDEAEVNVGKYHNPPINCLSKNITSL